MTAYTWTTGDDGDWGVAANWTATPSGYPNASTATVTISVAGSYTVTIAGGESFTAHTVTLNSSGAVLEVDGTLTLAGSSPTLIVTAGELDLFGELIGGTVTAGAGGTLVLEYGATLDGVTWQAPLTFTFNQALNVTGGLKVETAAGGTPGSIDMTAGSDRLDVEDSETLNNATLNFGSVGGDYLYNFNGGAGGTLTLGSGFTVEQSGGTDYLENVSSGDAIANAGKITVTGGDLAVGGTFTNSGTITISGSGTVDLSQTALTSSGHISVGAGSELVLAGGFTNTGSITIADGGTLDLTGSVTLSELTHITNSGGTLMVDSGGTLDLGGGTITVASTGLYSDVVVYGQISDGTVKLTTGSITLENSATLDGVTWLGALTFAYGTSLNVTGGLTVKTAAGGTPGLIDMTAGYDSLYVEDSETLNNATLNFGSADQDYLSVYDSSDAGLTLTLGSGFTVEQSGGGNYLSAYYGYANETIVNAGKIEVTGGDLVVNVGSFTNSGSITISDGGTVDLSQTTLTTSGHITIDAGSELVLAGGFSNTGSITIASTGTLDLTGSLTLSELAGITNSGGTLIVDSYGALALGGGTLTVASTGAFSDAVVYGELSAGTVKLSGGAITLEYGATLDGVTWLGTLTLAYQTQIYVTGGLTVKTAAGGTPGSIDMTAGYDSLNVEDSETLNNATLNFGSNGQDYLYVYDPSNNGLTLTLGSGFIVEQSGGNEYLSGYADDAIANAGKIEVTGGDLIVNVGTFTNSGSITISDGGTVDLSQTALTSSGHISIGAGSELVLGTGFSNTGSITIASTGTLNLTGYVTLAETTGITNSGGTLVVGAVTYYGNTGTLDLGGGTLTVATTGLFSNIVVYGEISDGTVKLSGGSIALEYGATLDDVTWLGTLTFGFDQSVNVAGGLTVKTATGGTPGSIDMTAGDDSLSVEDSETLNNATLNFGSNGQDSLSVDYYNSGGTLTLGSGFTIEQSGGQNDLYAQDEYDDGLIINDGKINVSGGDLVVQDGSFTNSGSITISDGGEVDLSHTTLTSSGHISIGADSELVLGAGFSNTGSITIASTGTLDLTGSVTPSELTGITNSGGTLMVDSSGVLDLGGGTLTVGTTGLFSDVVIDGGLADGTVKLAGGSITLNGATLGGVTWLGTLTFAANQHVYVYGGLTVETATGGTPGSIDMTAGGDSLNVEDSETLDNTTLNFGSVGGDNLSLAFYTTSPSTLTLGSGFTIEQSGGGDLLDASIFGGGGGIVNDGKINVSGGELYTDGASFTNSGSITISGGGTVDLSSVTLTSSGSISVGETSELRLRTGFSNTGSITIESTGTLDLTGTVPLSELTGITNSGGTLMVDYNGTLDLGGGTMDVATTGLFSNTVIAGTLSDGTVKLAGGKLTLASGATLDPITFLGPLTFTANQTLNIVGGLTVETASGGFPGLIDMTAGGDSLVVEDSETLDNATLDFGSAGGGALDNDGVDEPGLALTLGSGFTIEQSGGSNVLSNAGYYYDGISNTTIDAGKITVTGGDFIVQGGTFTTSGSIAISGGGEVDLSDTALTNSGDISVGAGSELLLGTGFSNTGSITIDSGGTLALAGTVTLSELTGITNNGGLLQIDNGATFDLGGSTVTVATTGLFSDVVVNGELSDGTVKLSGGSITLESDVTLNSVTWQGALTFSDSQNLYVTGGLTVETSTGGIPGSIDMTAGSDALYVEDSETLNNATLNFGSAGGNALVGYSYPEPLTLGSNFIIEQSGGYNYLGDVYGANTLANAGKISVTGGELFIPDNVLFSNTGSITVSGGYIDIDANSFTSSGSIVIGNGGTLEIVPSTNANITYDDPANLILDNPATYTGTISGLMTGDTLQLDGENITSAGISGTTLTVNLTGGGTLSYNTGPGLDGTKFSVSRGTDNYYTDLLTVLCFLPGTLIATPAGETLIERLAVGDMVRTASGAVRPIAWIGQGKVMATRGHRTAATPVVVSKGALGPNVPHHDLRVTKGHSFLLDGVLIPVEFLVNHRTIYWDDRAQEVTLYHIELETHDVLLANGAAAESYRDDGNRWLFQNANSGWDQPAKPPCAPVLTGGPVVDAVWRRLLDRAGGPTQLPLTQDARLALVVDGARLLPTVLRDDMAVFILGRRPRDVRLVSRAAVPLELGLARDARELGVAVRRVAIRKGSQPRVAEAADARLIDGFHDFEAETGIRWTNGDAVLPADLFAGLKGEIEVAIHLGGATQYLDDGELLLAA